MSSGQKWWAEKEEEERLAERAIAEKAVDEALAKLKLIPQALNVLAERHNRALADQEIYVMKDQIERKYGLKRY